MSYCVLVFEPNIIENGNKTILWKAQIDAYPNYKSINFALIQDNIEFDNRRTIEKWFEFFEINNIKYEIEFDSEYAKSLLVIDGELKFFNIQLFACDVKASNYYLEVEPDYIIAVLHILELKKYGTLFPNFLLKKIARAKDLLNSNRDLNLLTADTMLNYLKTLEKLADHCAYYENDIKYHIVEH